MKLRFKLQVDGEYSWYDVLAQRKSTGKWERIGTCNIAAKDAVKNGRFELIQMAELVQETR